MDIPYGKSAIIERFGNPDSDNDFVLDKDFQMRYLIKKPLPFPLRLPWGNATSRNIYGHRAVVPYIIEFFIAVADTYGGYDILKKANLDIWGGCFMFRTKTNGRHLSTHAWGIAFDYLTALGAYGQQSQIPEEIIHIAEDLGFENGGHWSVPDGMHFQMCRGY